MLLADDEALIRAGIRFVLEVADDIEIVAEADNGAEAATDDDGDSSEGEEGRLGLPS
ncbi:hypothetical protein [Streptomyces sp. MNU76]|uniref:hypothetical protein n=1 Tax=Streptomyces sp. MNU76 TaxID=2560026 RepID=UPI0035A906F5